MKPEPDEFDNEDDSYDFEIPSNEMGDESHDIDIHALADKSLEKLMAIRMDTRGTVFAHSPVNTEGEPQSSESQSSADPDSQEVLTFGSEQERTLDLEKNVDMPDVQADPPLVTPMESDSGEQSLPLPEQQLSTDEENLSLYSPKTTTEEAADTSLPQATEYPAQPIPTRPDNTDGTNLDTPSYSSQNANILPIPKNTASNHDSLETSSYRPSKSPVMDVPRGFDPQDDVLPVSDYSPSERESMPVSTEGGMDEPLLALPINPAPSGNTGQAYSPTLNPLDSASSSAEPQSFAPQQQSSEINVNHNLTIDFSSFETLAEEVGMAIEMQLQEAVAEITQHANSQLASFGANTDRRFSIQ